jgi:hypothetical protein
MSKPSKQADDDGLRPEYDFSSLSGGVRGKYYQQFRAGVNLRLLEPEVAKAFPTDTAVNRALRTVLRAAKPSKKRAGLPNKRMQLTRSAKARRRGPRS